MDVFVVRKICNTCKVFKSDEGIPAAAAAAAAVVNETRKTVYN
jgi:hypothetical protein